MTVQFGGEDEAENLALDDLADVINGYLAIKREYFDELLSSVKKTKTFFVSKRLLNVTSPDKEDWTNNGWLLVFARVKEKELPVQLLIRREHDLAGTIVAFGPDEFSKHVKKNGGEELRKMMEYLVSFPHKFDATVLLPHFMAQETAE